jgi:hypothetical protein
MNTILTVDNSIGGVSIRVRVMPEGRGYPRQLFEIQVPDEHCTDLAVTSVARCFQQSLMTARLWDWCAEVAKQPRPEEINEEKSG